MHNNSLTLDRKKPRPVKSGVTDICWDCRKRFR